MVSASSRWAGVAAIAYANHCAWHESAKVGLSALHCLEMLPRLMRGMHVVFKETTKAGVSCSPCRRCPWQPVKLWGRTKASGGGGMWAATPSQHCSLNKEEESAPRSCWEEPTPTHHKLYSDRGWQSLKRKCTELLNNQYTWPVWVDGQPRLWAVPNTVRTFI